MTFPPRAQHRHSEALSESTTPAHRAALALATAALLVGCAFAPPETRTPDPALRELADSLTRIDGVQDAVAAPSYDGSPSAKRLTMRIYLDEPAFGDLAAISTQSLELGWKFDGFTPASYVLQVWNGPRQTPPYDNSKRVDLAPVLDRLDLPTSRAYKGDPTASTDDLWAKFGARE